MILLPVFILGNIFFICLFIIFTLINTYELLYLKKNNKLKNKLKKFIYKNC